MDEFEPGYVIDGRFRVIRTVGRGGFGVVYLVHDARDGVDCALKTVLGATEDARGALRREFRVVRRVQHENILPRWALFETSLTYLTMPYVEGRHLDEAVAAEGPDPGDRVEALRRYLPGILSGMAALHGAGLAHGDIKPSNILASSSEVQLLDFGTTRHEDEQEFVHGGNFAYLAPERFQDWAPTPESDVFALGRLLYLCIAGNLPEVSTASLDVKPPPTGAPPEVQEVLEQMMRREPRHRPKLAEIAAAFRVRPPTGVRRGFIGREFELGLLHAHLDAVRQGESRFVHLHGPAGRGKSALVRAFLAQVRGRTLLARGACDRTEAVPYAGIAGAFDDLVGRWTGQDPMPVLQGVSDQDGASAAELIHEIRPIFPSAEPPPEVGPDERRARSMLALRKILRALSESQPILFVIEDFQWAGRDAAKLLEDLAVGEDTPRALWLITTRDGDDRPAWTPPARANPHDFPLGSLLPEDARELARLAFGEEVDADAIQNIAERPFLSSWVLRAGGARRRDPGEAIVAALEALPPDRRLVVELATLSAEPITADALLAAAGLKPSWASQLSALEDDGWITADAQAEPHLSAYHGIIADTVSSALAESIRPQRHEALYQSWSEHSGNPPTLYEHAKAAGRNAQAAVHAAEAAEAATSHLAFDSAGVWFARAAAHGTPTLSTEQAWARAAESYGYWGHARDAGHAWLRAAEAVTQDGSEESHLRAIRHRASAAAELVRGGFDAEGDPIFEEVLAEFGETLPGNGTASILDALRLRLMTAITGWKVTPRSEPLSPRDAAHLDVIRMAGYGYALSKYIRADTLGLRHLRLAVRLGSVTHAIRAYATESAVEAAIAVLGLDVRAQNMLAYGETLIGDDLELQAFTYGGRASVEWSFGDWTTAREFGERSQALYAQHTTGTRFELVVLRTFLLSSMWWSGDLPALARSVDDWRKHAVALNDEFYNLTLTIGESSSADLVRGRPEVVLDNAAKALTRWRPDEVTTQRYLRLHGVLRAFLYVDQPERAWAEVQSEWPLMARAFYVGLNMTGPILHLTRGQVTNAMAARTTGVQRWLWVRRSMQSAKALRRAKSNRVAQPMADIVTAGALRAQGRDQRAVETLRRAVQGFDEGQMRLYAACGRAVDPDIAIAAVGQAWLRDAGVVDLPAFVRCMVAGWPLTAVP